MPRWWRKWWKRNNTVITVPTGEVRLGPLQGDQLVVVPTGALRLVGQMVDRRIVVPTAKRPSPSAQAWSYVGIPYPTETTTELTALGYTAWPYDPCTLTVPSHPDGWVTPTAGYYYVNRSGGGSDSGNPYGSVGSPRATIPRPVPAGSVVYIAGTYDYNQGGIVWVQGNGTSATWSANSAGPVFITGNGTLNSASKSIVYGDHIIVDGAAGLTCAHLVQVASESAGYDSTYITLRNLTMDLANKEVSAISLNDDASASHHYMVYNCDLSNGGNINSATDDDRTGIQVTGGTTEIWVIDTNISTFSGSGVQFIGGNAVDGVHNERGFVGGCDVYRVRQAGIWVKFGTDIVFSSNTVHNIIDTPWSVSKGMGAQYEPEGLWLINNHIYTANEDVNIGPADGDGIKYGIRVPSTYAPPPTLSVYAIGNLIHDTVGNPGGTDSWDPCAINIVGGGSRYIINNTIYNCASGIHIASNSGTTEVYNNIISTLTDAQGKQLYTEGSTPDCDYNRFYDASGEVYRRVSTDYTTLADWRTASGGDANSTEGDPGFTNAAGGDFTLTAELAGQADTSLPTDVYQIFESRFGLDIRVDRAGTVRPQGSWTIGAYERGA